MRMLYLDARRVHARAGPGAGREGAGVPGKGGGRGGRGGGGFRGGRESVPSCHARPSPASSSSMASRPPRNAVPPQNSVQARMPNGVAIIAVADLTSGQ